MKILILKPSSLGDVVQALPVLRLIKLHWPRSEIFWWIDAALAPLLEGDPDLTGIVRFQRSRWATPVHWHEIWQSIAWMRAQRFDLVIDLQCLARSGAFAWLANGQFLVGLDEIREGARGFYDIAVRRASRHTHAVDWYLAVLQALRVPADRHFDWLPVRPIEAAGLRRKWNADSARWILLQPGARWANKRWPADHYATLLRHLMRSYPEHRFAVMGGEADRPVGQTILQGHSERCLDLTGRISLVEMVEWIRRSDLLITNDTGPMHVAAALGTPLVALFGPTEPRRTGPYGQPGNVLQTALPCVPCMQPYCTYAFPIECLRSISPAAVLAAAQRVCPVSRVPQDAESADPSKIRPGS